MPKITAKKQPEPPDIKKRVEKWFDTLEPLNKTATVSEKLLAHIELKEFVTQFMLE
jgi:hypothetical protein